MNTNAETNKTSSVLEHGETRIIQSCNQDRYEDGVAFRFILPDGLSLSAVDVEDGVPKLRFAASPKVPTVNEEDVAVCVRLSLEEKRPEFFYIGFPFHHPFFGTRRLYKFCRPEYLRKSSVGKLFADVDWLMKCLHVGVRTSSSDKSETIFSSWSETSHLGGLAIRTDFPEDLPNATVVMSCKSVEVQRSDKELIFGESKMRIDAVDRKSNLLYSKYITEIFDSVAYDDALLFLKMKEIVKLVLAMEWLKEKGVKFSTQWVMEHTNKPRQTPLRAIDARSPKMSEDVIQYVMNQLQLQTHTQERQISLSPTKSLLTIRTTLEDKTVTERSLKLKVKTTLSLSTPDSSMEDVNFEKTTVLRLSVNDYDMLYEGINPNSPIGIDDSGELITPNVGSWSELFSETVPFPCIWRLSPGGIATPAVIGGVTTRNIPVKEVPVTAATKTNSQVQKTREPIKKAISNPVTQQNHYMQHGDEIAVTASSARQRRKPKSSMIPTTKVVKRPSSDVGVRTREAEFNRALSRQGVETRVGCIDAASSSMFTGSGRQVEQRQSVQVRAEHKLRLNGEKVVPDRTSFDMIRLPPALTQASGNEPKQPQRENMELPSLSEASAQQLVDAKGSPTASEDSGYRSLLNGQGSAQQNPVDIERTSNPSAVDQPAGVTVEDSDRSSITTDSGISTPQEQSELESSDNSSDDSDEMDTEVEPT